MNRPHGSAVAARLDFSVNVNPLGPPEGLRDILEGALGELGRYPDEAVRIGREAISRHLGTPPELVLLTNGSSEAVYLVVRALAKKRVLVYSPSFTEYEDAAEAVGVRVVRHLPVEPWRWEEPRLEPDDLVLFGRPNNPTGSMIETPRGGVSVADEAFIDFAEPRPIERGVVTIRSMTKIFALPGLRLGFVVARPEIVLRLRRHQPPWPVNALAARAAAVLYDEREYLERSCRYVKEARAEFLSELGAIAGLHPYPSVANFVLCRVPDAASLCRALAARGFAVRNCDSFSGLEPGRYVRFAVRLREENALLAAAIREAL